MEDVVSHIYFGLAVLNMFFNVSERSRVTPTYFGFLKFFSFCPFHMMLRGRLASLFLRRKEHTCVLAGLALNVFTAKY